MLTLNDVRQKPVYKAVEILKKLKNWEVMTTKELAAKTGVSYSYFRSTYAKKPELANNRHTTTVKGQKMTLWGNLHAIENLKEMVG